MGRISSHLVVQDAVVPRTQAPRSAGRDSPRSASQHRVNVCNVFHAGDGNLHPNIPYDATDPDETARVHSAMREIMTACIRAGGTITGEHGVGLDKLDYMEPASSRAESLATMCTLRDVFDPDRRSNPGKVVPVHACREWHMAPAARPAPRDDASSVASAADVREQIVDAAQPRHAAAHRRRAARGSTPAVRCARAKTLSHRETDRDHRVRARRSHAHRARRHDARRDSRGDAPSTDSGSRSIRTAATTRPSARRSRTAIGRAAAHVVRQTARSRARSRVRHRRRAPSRAAADAS